MLMTRYCTRILKMDQTFFFVRFDIIKLLQLYFILNAVAGCAIATSAHLQLTLKPKDRLILYDVEDYDNYMLLHDWCCTTVTSRHVLVNLQRTNNFTPIRLCDFYRDP